MRQFFKIFFASLLASFVFVGLLLLLSFGIIGAVASSAGDKPELGSDAVLLIDLNQPLPEQTKENPFGIFEGEAEDQVGLHQAVRLIDHAATDAKIKGIYIKGGFHANGWAATEEVRAALERFKKTDKFIIAYGDIISQSSYAFASVADEIYVQPAGMLEWTGMRIELTFFKRLLDKWEVNPQVFYAGKFKSATEPFRFEKMSDPNRLQLSELQHQLYAQMLANVGNARKLDTAKLRQLAFNGTIQRSEDAVANGLVDGAWYDDQVKNRVFKLMGKKTVAKINFVSLGKYAKATDLSDDEGGKMALIYADGEIVDGMGEAGTIGSIKFKNLIRKARMDSSIKAIVLRVNSPGGSAIASDVIWNELILARKAKPVVVSMGDYAASGGYYIAAPATKIFAQPTTLTGSIGVFAIVPDMSGLLGNKLGITFDEISTGPYGGGPTVTRPLTSLEKARFQRGVDTTYETFKSRVAAGRNLSVERVDEVGQGRVWTGLEAKRLGLVDELGSLRDAIAYAAKTAKLKTYRLKQYPEEENIFKSIMGGGATDFLRTQLLGQELSSPEYLLLQKVKQLKASAGQAQARLPWEMKLY